MPSPPPIFSSSAVGGCAGLMFEKVVDCGKEIPFSGILVDEDGDEEDGRRACNCALVMWKPRIRS